MPKWLQILLPVVLNVGAIFVATKYPAYSPLVAAAAGSLGVPLTVHTYNTDPAKGAK